MNNIIDFYELRNTDNSFYNGKLSDFLSLSESILIDLTKTSSNINEEIAWIKDNFQNKIFSITLHMENNLFGSIMETANKELKLISKINDDLDKSTDYIELLIDLERQFRRLTDNEIESNIDILSSNLERVAI
ncbi:hypothetical protein [Staphylococcus equorum]|uniref:hypothetical protein n=1 Tax=Staphylococcus equorum TaxID=246432 RepID=UPI000DFA15CF|nr:hypothetical protein [Staphylococcus equorum]QQT23340.1 hypothetical protein I6J06_02685 [Staphylococcus equorum]RTX76985.1 hypothetical protein CD125_10440 [Staphylococcus equorum subsp. equorum]SUM25393.1 Uncharacterised protein [Staphylococcus equorum]